MRRKDREVTDFEQIKKIVQNSHVIRMGINTDDYPYVVPTNFGYEFDGDQLTLYIHGAPVGTKRELIAKNPHIGFEMDDGGEYMSPEEAKSETPSYAYQSVMGNGDASFIEDTQGKIQALQHILIHETGHKMEHLPEKDVAYVGIIKIVVKSLTGKVHFKN